MGNLYHGYVSHNQMVKVRRLGLARHIIQQGFGRHIGHCDTIFLRMLMVDSTVCHQPGMFICICDHMFTYIYIITYVYIYTRIYTYMCIIYIYIYTYCHCFSLCKRHGQSASQVIIQGLKHFSLSSAMILVRSISSPPQLTGALLIHFPMFGWFKVTFERVK